MAHPTVTEAERFARDDAKEAVGIVRSGAYAYPIVTIADGDDHKEQTTGFHKHWWRQHDEKWPADVRDVYNDTFTRELLAAKVAVVELQFDGAGGKSVFMPTAGGQSLAVSKPIEEGRAPA